MIIKIPYHNIINISGFLEKNNYATVVDLEDPEYENLEIELIIIRGRETGRAS